MLSAELDKKIVVVSIWSLLVVECVDVSDVNSSIFVVGSVVLEVEIIEVLMYVGLVVVGLIEAVEVKDAFSIVVEVKNIVVDILSVFKLVLVKGESEDVISKNGIGVEDIPSVIKYEFVFGAVDKELVSVILSVVDRKSDVSVMVT